MGAVAPHDNLPACDSAPIASCPCSPRAALPALPDIIPTDGSRACPHTHKLPPAMLCRAALPFGSLLSRGLKKMPIGFGIVLTIIAVGIYLERYLVTVPSVWMEDTFPPILPFIGSALFFLGLFLLVVIKYLESVPPVPVSDPHMLPHPDDVHVHSRDAHHEH